VSPDGTRIAYTIEHPRRRPSGTDKKYGAFEIVDEAPARAHLYLVMLSREPPPPDAGRVCPSEFPGLRQAARMAFDQRAGLGCLPRFGPTPRSSQCRRDPAPAGDQTPPRRISRMVAGWDPHRLSDDDGNPDSLWDTRAGRTILPVGGPIEPLAKDFDNNPYMPQWGPPGIFFWSLDRASASLYRIDPGSGHYARVGPPPPQFGAYYSFNRDYSVVAYVGGDAATMARFCVAPVKTMAGRRVTSLGCANCRLARSTVNSSPGRARTARRSKASCTSRPIFRPGTRYPLLVHGTAGRRRGASDTVSVPVIRTLSNSG